jgi:L-asparaginase II
MKAFPMHTAETLIEIWRADFLECQHRGHAVVSDSEGNIIASWGNPDQVILPRSSSKMLQALTLVETGAAAAFGLGTEQLALACASHRSAAMHTDRVQAWLDNLGLADEDFRCGAHQPKEAAARHALRDSGQSPCQYHNNCSGKHSGFLTVNKHIGGHSEYVEIDHPLQKAVKEAFEEMTGLETPGYGIDGCNAPNFATTVTGLARAMARMANPVGLGAARESAARTLVSAMCEHPLLVAGEGRACSELMAAMDGKVAIKTGAEGVYVAILPEQGLGVALKIEDGATRASEAAIASILVRLGVLPPDHPSAKKRINPHILNCRSVDTGFIRPADSFYRGGAHLI